MRSTNKLQGFLAILLLTAVLAGGCAGGAMPAAAPVAAPAGNAVTANLPKAIDVTTANQVRNRDDVFVLDVREPDEFASGHIPGATLIPLGQLSSRLNELPKDKTIVAVCRSGNRSGQATELLLQQGFDAHNMQGGMNAWTQAGFDVQK